jgi:hypothetical protein
MTLQEQRRRLWAQIYTAQFGIGFNVEAACKAADAAVFEFDSRFHDGGPASGADDALHSSVDSGLAGTWPAVTAAALPEPEVEEGGES